MPAPVLETERLILRAHAPSDFPAYAAMWADPDVTRFIGGAPLSEEEAWGKLLRTLGMWVAMDFGFWSVVEKSSGLRIGETGFLEGKRDISPSLKGIPEVGWAFVPAAHGKGFATGRFARRSPGVTTDLEARAWPASSRPKTQPLDGSLKRPDFARRIARSTRAQTPSCFSAIPRTVPFPRLTCSARQRKCCHARTLLRTVSRRPEI